MRLDALETKDMLTQRATDRRGEDGDKEGLLLEQRRRRYFTLVATLHGNRKSTSKARKVHLSEMKTIIPHDMQTAENRSVQMK